MTKTENKISELLQLWGTEELLTAVRGMDEDSPTGYLFRHQLASRGLDREGQWVGFPAAHETWEV